VEGNPVFVYHDLMNDDKQEVEELKERYKKGKVGDVEVKKRLIAAHQRMFKVARERREKLKGSGVVEEIWEKGAKKAKEVAEKTLKEVYETTGVRLE